MCIPVIDPTCVVESVVGGIANSAVEGLAEALREATKFFIRESFASWIKIPSVNLNNTGASLIRDQLRWVALAVCIGGVLWGGIRMAFRKKSEPAFDVFTGLIRVAVVNSLAFIVPQLLLTAGDDFSKWVLNDALSDQVANRLGVIGGLGALTNPGAVILGAIVMIAAGVIQALLMFFREGGIIILTGVLVLASAGGVNPATKSWFPSVAGKLTALILYKPMAALVYAAALNQIGAADDPKNFFLGLAMMILAIVALPSMMKFFTWAAPGAVSAASGGGFGGLGAAAAGAAAMRGARGGGGGSGPGGGHTASDQGARIERTFSQPGGAGPTGAPMASVGSASTGSSAAAGSGAAAGGAAAGGGAAAAGAAVPVAGAVIAAAQVAKQAADTAKNKASGAMTGDDAK